MLAKSFKFKNYACFGDQWAGFDEIKMINLIIGRNNIGKTKLLDLLDFMTKEPKERIGREFLCSGELDETSLRAHFRPDYQGGGMIGDHWADNGRLYTRKFIEWSITPGGKIVIPATVHDGLHNSHIADVRNGRNGIVANIAQAATNPLTGRTLVRITADRDITPESDTNETELNPNGGRATNLIQKHITSANPKYPRSRIQRTVLGHLNEIFADDASFTEISVQQFDDREGSPWEVFLEEKGKDLVSLSDSGSGLKTILLVLLSLYVVPAMQGKDPSSYVFGFEELENNLHPALLRRLLSHIARFGEETGAIFFLTSHSSVTLDFFQDTLESQVVRVLKKSGTTCTERVDRFFDRHETLCELGVRPSDVLQANGIIWVEGPSDRIYVNKWIELYSDGAYQEGRHYQCAFYGGSLLGAVQMRAPEEEARDLANLIRLNPNAYVICDSDRTSTNSVLKPRVKRIKEEVDQIPSAGVWVLKGREIENYITSKAVQRCFNKKVTAQPGLYELVVPRKSTEQSYLGRIIGKKLVDKTDLAISITPFLDLQSLNEIKDWSINIIELVNHIERWNK